MQPNRTLLVAAFLLATVAPARAQVTINFWDNLWGPPKYQEVARRLVAEFNKTHPAIQVRYRTVASTQWYQTFVTAIATGDAPDLSSGGAEQPFDFYAKGAILPIDDVVEELRRTGELDDFLPGTMERMRYDGHTIALPFGTDIRVWYYRKDYFAAAGQKVPETWDELRHALKAVTNADHYGMVGSGDNGGSHYVWTLMLNNGGGLFAPNGSLDFDNPRNLEAFAYLADLARDGSVDPASPGYSSPDRRAAFLKGREAVIVDHPAFQEQAAPEVIPQIGLLPPLKGPHGDVGNIGWVNSITISRQSKHPAEAKVFLLWWSKNNKPLFTEGHADELPVRRSIAQDGFFTKDPYRSYIIEHYLPSSRNPASHLASAFPQLNAIEGEGVMWTLTAELLQGKDMMDVLEHARTRLRSLMQ